MELSVPSTHVTRRTLLAGLVGVGAAAALSACSGSGGNPRPVGSDTISVAEAARRSSGRTRTFVLKAEPTRADLGGTVVDTWTYGGRIPGRALHATAGDRVKIAFSNALPQETSVHWHGLAIRNDMDGVPGLTTPSVAPNGSFAYEFIVPDAGTYWFHPHTGLQTDRGLYAPFIVDANDEPGAYDAEWVLVLDDWTDGVGKSPEQIYAELTANNGSGSGNAAGGMSGMDHGSMGGMPGMDHGSMGMNGMNADSGDVTYPLYLLNGTTAMDPDVLTAKPGQKVRLRIINAAADTIFDLALDRHRLTITHTDGYPVTPAETSALRVGMGERYDAIVTLADGIFPLVVQPVGKDGSARALVRTGAGSVPAADFRPANLSHPPLTVAGLTAAAGSALAAGTPKRTQDLVLGGSMSPYVWTINGKTYDKAKPLTVRQGELTRLRIRNQTMMSHPLHVHGHTFQIGAAGGTGPRKDTVLLPSMGAVDVDLLADNPGQWMVHCHNAYHAEAGMMTRLDYVR